jgi:anion-transporting  ArsA/GET3 family ATPase
MRTEDFCKQSRVIVVAGKGGVGKSTITAAVAQMAASAGLSVLIVDLEGKSGMPAAFGRSEPLDYGEAVLSNGTKGEVRARRITPDDALIEYLAEHGMKRVSKRLVSSGAIDVVSTAIPGIRDILVLGKVKQLERSGTADLILLDAPATGHAMTFLSSARGLLDAARSGPVRAQAAEVLEMLADSTRCQVMLVTLPEEMPVNEVVEAAFALEDRIGMSLGPIVVNGCLPALDILDEDPDRAARELGIELAPDVSSSLGRAAAFRSRRRALQEEQIQRLADALPLPQLRAPLLFEGSIGPVETGILATSIEEEIGRLDGGGA